ncbi:monocarboxylate transporter 9-like [Centruroides vittatus]|uniref:monocarboxylate transporter 9-like n=1 Tax=Centruroides vittatus TaxID=120091 RepID=UPI00350FD61D
MPDVSSTDFEGTNNCKTLRSTSMDEKFRKEEALLLNPSSGSNDEQGYAKAHSAQEIRSSASLPSSPSETEGRSMPVPPDGGWGWVVVFASFMINLISDGVSLSFGILFVDLVNYFGESKGKTAWVGSIFLSMPLLTGPIASYLTDRYGCRKISIIGALLSALGFMASYFSHSLEMLFLMFSLSGFGLALCYVTSIVIVAYYFEKKRSLATGLAVCGTGIGTFVFAPLTIYLLENYAWRGTLLILSGFFLNIVAFGALMRDLDNPKSCDNVSNDEGKNEITEECNLESKSFEEAGERLCSSLVHLPTYINSSNVPVEVITELSNKEGGYLNSLLEHYPNILKCLVTPEGDDYTLTVKSTLPLFSVIPPNVQHNNNEIVDNKSPEQSRKNSTWSTKSESQKASCLRNMRLQRGSITYRGAMLNIRRYRLRASSCPDIYRNSMMTITESEKSCSFLTDLKDVIIDMFDLSIFKNLRYTIFCISNFLLYACVDVPYVYLPDNAINHGVDKEAASFLISILGILNTGGVVMVGYIGDKSWIDSSVLYSAFIAISGVVMGAIPLIIDYYGTASLVAIYGFTISANYTLVSVIVVNLISLDCFTNAYGLLLLVQGVASLVGPPLAGWLFDLTGNYDVTFYLTGICIFVSGVLVVPVAKSRKPARSSSLLNNNEASEVKDRKEKVRFEEEKSPESICNKTIASSSECNGYINSLSVDLNKKSLDEKRVHLKDENFITIHENPLNSTNIV